MELKKEKTARGFDIIGFQDQSGRKCSLQKSSSEDAVLFGVNDADPQIMASKIIDGGIGWAKYPIPSDVHFVTKMLLTREQVASLLPVLTRFAETGDL